MKLFNSYLIIGIILVTPFELKAQEDVNDNIVYPAGINIEYGFGNYSVVDEYISKEKYTGTLPFFGFGWTRAHNKYVYQLGLEFRHSNDIKNYTVSTDLYQFRLNQGFLYSIHGFSIFGKNTNLFIGPSTEFFFYVNDQQIAVSGFDYTQSFAALFSLGCNSGLVYPLSDHFNIESALDFNVISLGFRIVDSEESDESPVMPLTLFSGLNLNFRFGARYYLIENLSLKANYLMNTTRISSWDKLTSASDNLVFGISFNF